MGIMWGVLTAVDWGKAGREAAALDESEYDKRQETCLNAQQHLTHRWQKKKVNFNMEKFGTDRLVELFQPGTETSLAQKK